MGLSRSGRRASRRIWRRWRRWPGRRWRAGIAAAAERHLRRAVAVDPLRERAQRALMQALAAGGNYAAALLAYRELRLRLHRELNAEPDPETQALFSSSAPRRGTKAEEADGPRAGGQKRQLTRPDVTQRPVLAAPNRLRTTCRCR